MTAAEVASQAYFRPRRIGHANIFVGELERSMAFYNRVVGLREAYRRPPIGAGFLNNGNTHHDIGMVEISNPMAGDAGVGLFHIGWELENQVDLVAGYRSASAEGVAFDYMFDHDISHSVYFRDPDGFLNEMYADTRKRWWRDRSGDVHDDNVRWVPGMTPPDPEPNYVVDPEIVRVEEAVFHPIKITGCALVVDDYEGALDFYTEQVGLTATIGGAGSPCAVLSGALGLRDLAIWRADDARPAQLHHMNFACADAGELEASLDRAAREGIEIEAEIDRPDRRAVVIRDPDGLRINFYVDRGGPPDAAALAGGDGIYLA